LFFRPGDPVVAVDDVTGIHDLPPIRRGRLQKRPIRVRNECNPVNAETVDSGMKRNDRIVHGLVGA
jgi:hypothetical protein